MFYRLMLLLCCCLSGPLLAKQAFYGTVTFVTDGDTLWVAPAQGGAVRKLRIDGLDAPEICQAGGVAARAVLMDAARVCSLAASAMALTWSMVRYSWRALFSGRRRILSP